MKAHRDLGLSDPASARATAHLLKELLVLAEATQGITAELSLEKLLQRIVDHARNLLGCRYAALSVMDEGRKITSFITSGLDEEARRDIGSLPTGKGLLGLILDSTDPLRIEDISQHPSTGGFPPGHPAMKSLLGIAIRYGGQTRGNLYLTDKEDGRPFSDIDAQLIAMFAAQAGIAMENARLFAEAEERRKEAIQERISLEAIINSMTEGIYTLDADWRIRRVNPHAARMVNKDPRDILGLRCWDVFQYMTQNGRSLCQTACPARQAIAAQRPGYVMEAMLPGKERPVPVALLADIILNAAGQVVGVVETVRDITQRKEVDEVRDNIISLVSHELRTPLSHIKGFSSSLLQPDIQWDEETKLDFMRSIEREADRLSRLVSDLLEMSRLDSGRTMMRPEPVDAASLVLGAIERTANFLQDHIVEMDVTRNLPRLAVDPVHAERVLENLLENAAKYSPPGTQITISAQMDGAYLRLSVHDQGMGVPDQDKERIFERFVRLEQSKAFRSPGTGLGLSICKSIVEAHGGRIWVEDNPGKGSIFFLTLPLAQGRRRRSLSSRE
ncbi:MAG: GAF domain-containing protein [Chloroflexi bacterium]|nr:GAF domain-containing protein [Chloroflexota bacterium]